MAALKPEHIPAQSKAPEPVRSILSAGPSSHTDFRSQFGVKEG